MEHTVETEQHNIVPATTSETSKERRYTNSSSGYVSYPTEESEDQKRNVELARVPSFTSEVFGENFTTVGPKINPINLSDDQQENREQTIAKNVNLETENSQTFWGTFTKYLSVALAMFISGLSLFYLLHKKILDFIKKFYKKLRNKIRWKACFKPDPDFFHSGNYGSFTKNYSRTSFNSNYCLPRQYVEDFDTMNNLQPQNAEALRNSLNNVNSLQTPPPITKLIKNNRDYRKNRLISTTTSYSDQKSAMTLSTLVPVSSESPPRVSRRNRIRYSVDELATVNDYEEPNLSSENYIKDLMKFEKGSHLSQVQQLQKLQLMRKKSKEFMDYYSYPLPLSVSDLEDQNRKNKVAQGPLNIPNKLVPNRRSSREKNNNPIVISMERFRLKSEFRKNQIRDIYNLELR